MKHGFVKVAAVTPKVEVGNVDFNVKSIIEAARECAKAKAKIIVFPELCITGASCQDYFYQKALIKDAKKGLSVVADSTKNIDALLVVGLPLLKEGKLYDVAAVLSKGDVLGFVPKTVLLNHGENSESRWFASGEEIMGYVNFFEDEIPMGLNLIFACESMPELKVACEIGAEAAMAETPSVAHVQAGATLIVNPSATVEIVGRADYRRNTVKCLSSRLMSGYIHAEAGPGESTTDFVYAGHNLIAECGDLLDESKRFSEGVIYTDLDFDRIESERIKSSNFDAFEDDDYLRIPFFLNEEETVLSRYYRTLPFIPENDDERAERCEEIFTLQCLGLKKRCEHTHTKKLVLGISGGLDSTLALLVMAKTFDMLGYPRKDILTITMPCFGTSDRTYKNACEMTRRLGVTLEEVDIKESVMRHFEDIHQSMDNHDVTFENAQARERTQVLMDIANREGALVVGTGDLSELALGWATYNGDHMSMYSVNGDIPKTLVRHLVRHFAVTCGDKNLEEILLDVLDTPVSPELLPPTDGKIAQKTEDLVGPYELHDFFLYYTLRFGFETEKIYRIALKTFAGMYDAETIRKWLETFNRRFYAQQYKRSCLPDGPAVGTVGLSPRAGLKLPSDLKCGQAFFN